MEKRYPIGDVAFLLRRKPNTLRSWEDRGDLPEELWPHRDQNNRRYWTAEQVTGLQKWLLSIDAKRKKAQF